MSAALAILLAFAGCRASLSWARWVPHLACAFDVFCLFLSLVLLAFA